MMKDSKLDTAWLREMMARNPPSLRANGIIFSGPVRLCFPNLFKPQTAKGSDSEPKYGADLLFPLGADMSLFNKIWNEDARAAFPKAWDAQGNPIGLHIPFHDQREKSHQYAGYTPGAIHFTTSSKYKPQVVDGQMNLISDEERVYPGVWAFVGLNRYSYKNKKTGIGFGLQTVMIIADDQKLAGGSGDPTKDFAGVQISAQSNIAAKFDAAGAQQQPAGNVMPAGSYAGHQGSLSVHPVEDISSMM